MAKMKVDIRSDKKFANFIYGMFKALATDKKTKLDIEYCPRGLEWSKISGVLGEEKFELQPEYRKNAGSVETIYHLHIGDYETDFAQEYSTNLINGKLSHIVFYLQNKVREDYIFDENTKKYFPRPKRPNFFQRAWQRLRGK